VFSEGIPDDQNRIHFMRMAPKKASVARPGLFEGSSIRKEGKIKAVVAGRSIISTKKPQGAPDLTIMLRRAGGTGDRRIRKRRHFYKEPPGPHPSLERETAYLKNGAGHTRDAQNRKREADPENKAALT